MNIHPSLIGFDIDGVVADTMEAFIRIAGEDYGVYTISPEDITHFMVEDCLDIDPTIIDEIFTLLLDDPLKAGLKPMPYATVVLNELSHVAPLTFVTARPQREPIDKWLREVLGKSVYKKTRLVAMGEHDGKADYIKKFGLKYFVDDRAQTCIMLDQEGITPYVFSQPWNRGRHELETVKDWRGIRALCLGAEDFRLRDQQE
ncbi:MAG: hypothetical protein KAJ60_09670 [Desulfobulbaceae bacterium]|nr:hypothetical protein [Desulfobulbaceae bacterium]MCK5403701.1 hypothetical protein [Desulfobulbaceae bacterium]